MEFFLLWLIFSIAIAYGAGGRGRSGIGWFFISMLLSPLLAFMLLLLLPSRLPQPGVPTPETHVRCPDCRELVRKDARVCRHCGCRLVPEGEAPGAA